MREYLDFEKPIAEIEEKIEKLTAAGQERPGVQDDLRKLREKLYKLQAEIYPGLGAEERGQSEAIARNLMVMASLKVPIVSVVIGEGGSGGALAIGVADRVLMLQHAVYSVISPEGCAAILWNDPKKTPDAAEALKMTAEDLLRLGVIDEILPEPPGAAHRDPTAMCNAVKKAVEPHLSALLELPLDELLRRRHTKYRRMGALGGE